MASLSNLWRAIALSLTLFIAVTLGWPSASAALCTWKVHIEATDTNGSPDWTYTVTVIWVYDGSVDHWALILDSVDPACGCAEWTDALVLYERAGGAHDLVDCSMEYSSQFACELLDSGGQNLGMALTFTPTSDPVCELDDSGMAVFQFRSSLPPIPINTGDPEGPRVSALGGDDRPAYCGAYEVTGVMPSVSCATVSSDGKALGTLKGRYHKQ